MKGRVFSGARPTGRQHIGNYLGAIHNYVELQRDYECIYCIVDVHALTTLEATDRLQENIREMALDWLAAGIDPERSIVFVQSHVPEVLELHALLSMVTPLGWLLRVPTFKEKARQQPENINYGLLGYPVLMASDILLYKADTVPVGEDQLPHLELTREIARRFNSLFGDTFPEPAAKLTNAPLIMGLDGATKMSKSADNDLELAAGPQDTLKRVMTAFTDPARRFRDDPGHPDVCNVFSLRRYFGNGDLAALAQECQAAAIGCVDCKRQLGEEINLALAPFRERRASLASHDGLVESVLREGAIRARELAAPTLREVKSKMGLL